ncbi:somatostatin receptor type 4-like [Montipora foliosa]|uniref:somatostatin receptor type 4-like n=1 Tax=Montipora foliosa TaxID=591990 RepID=UPI0035F1F9C7
MNKTVFKRSNSSIIQKSGGKMDRLTQISYGIICVTAIFGNTLTIVMFVMERQLLKKSYNVLIMFLAISDVLTAVNIIISPFYVLGNAFPYPQNPIPGEIFCRFIHNKILVFHLIYFSVYITLVLTAERWFAVVRPHQYNHTFSRKKVVGYITLSWVWSLLLKLRGVINSSFNPSGDKICLRDYSRGSAFNIAWYAGEMVFKVVIPCLAIIGLYIHMTLKTIHSPTASAESKAKLKAKLTRMVTAASCTLIALYLPNQIVFLLSFTGKTKLGQPLHKFTSFLAFLTTCVNPFIYGLSNKNYQQRYWRILSAICLCLRRSNHGSVEDLEAVGGVRLRQFNSLA